MNYKKLSLLLFLIFFQFIILFKENIYAQQQPQTTNQAKLTVKVNPYPSRIEIWQNNLLEQRTISDESGNGEFLLTEGNYQIIVSHGFEYLLAKAELKLNKNEQKTISLNLEKFYDMNSIGWYSGDAHMHSIYSDGNQRIPILVKAAKSEGLNWVVSTDHNEGMIKTFQHLYKNQYDTKDFIIMLGEEVSTNILGKNIGHFNAINIKGFVDYKGSAKEIFDATHKYEGLVFPNHPFTGPLTIVNGSNYFWCVENDITPFASNFDGVEVWNGGWEWKDEEALKYWLYLLREGYKFFAIANTDSHHVYNSPLGTPRTYVYLGNNSLTKEAVMKALSEKRAFLTDGPLVEFKIQDKIPGDVLKIKSGEELNLNLKIKSLSELKEFIIVKNGFAFYQIEIKGQEYQTTIKIKPQRNSYYLVRVHTKDGRQAITNPIWVEAK